VNPRVQAFMEMARENLRQARWDPQGGFLRGAVSGAYYTMFYAATAALLIRGQEYSKHQGVVGAFGKEFARTGQLKPHLHRYLLDALDDRHEADYDAAAQCTEEQAGEEIARAEEFLAEVESYLSHADQKPAG
jgi:uncharacterized protein (UPF0332 family)